MSEKKPNKPFNFYDEVNSYNWLENMLYGLVRSGMKRNEEKGGAIEYGPASWLIRGLGSRRYDLPARQAFMNEEVKQYINELENEVNRGNRVLKTGEQMPPQTIGRKILDKIKPFADKRIQVGETGEAPFGNKAFLQEYINRLVENPDNLPVETRNQIITGNEVQSKADFNQKQGQVAEYVAETGRIEKEGDIDLAIQTLKAEIAEKRAARTAKIESEKRAAKEEYERRKLENDAAIKQAEIERTGLIDYANIKNEGATERYKLGLEQYQEDREDRRRLQRQQSILEGLDSFGDLLQNFN